MASWVVMKEGKVMGLTVGGWVKPMLGFISLKRGLAKNRSSFNVVVE